MRLIFLGIAIVALAGCSTNMGHRDPVEIKKTLNKSVNEASSRPLQNLPSAINEDLMPKFDDGKYVSTSALEKRFRVNASNVKASTFFSSLVKGTPFNVVIHPDVKGNITMKLNDVTLNEVLDVAADVYGYNFSIQGNIIQVFPATLRTEVIPVDYLQLQRSGTSLTSVKSGTVSDSGDGDSGGSSATAGTEITTTSNSDFWKQLEEVVRIMIGTGNGRSVMISPQAGLISVRAFPNELREVKAFLGISQKRLVRQVVLETKIMEVTLSDGYQQGVNWSNLTRSIGGTNIVVDQVVDGLVGTVAKVLGDGQTNITISDGNFSSVMSFLETQGDVNVLSSPRVTAANNQKAVIKVGTDEYFVTEVTGSESVGDDSESTPTVELTPFFSGISLDVTPQIDDEGSVLLHVHPAIVDVQSESKEFNVAGRAYNLPLAKSTIRESDSIIHARTGDVVVIGGLMKTSVSDQVSKVPLLGDIPVLGNLFRNIEKVKQKTELIILLKPTVVSDQTWQKEIERSRTLVDEWIPEKG